MKRFPDPAKFGVWAYFNGLYMIGQYMVYKRTGDPAYLKYIQGWADAHVDAKGDIGTPISGLDYIQPGNVLLMLYATTGQERYRIAAETIRRRVDTYPRTTDGGFWHSAVEGYKQHSLWLDGTFMVLPFLLRYSRMFGGEHDACNEAAKQLLLDDQHLRDEKTGLLYHAYDESAQAVWARQPGHHSSVFWCRSIGWYSVALVDALDCVPRDHPQRAKMIEVLQRLIRGIAACQDPATGLWYQVIDQPKLAGNWLETSSSCMFTYVIDLAVKRGYVPATLHEVAVRGHAGVMSQVSLNGDGLVDIRNICEGTDVSDVPYYLGRARNTNDPHGLGAFLMMNEEWNASTASMDFPAKKTA